MAARDEMEGSIPRWAADIQVAVAEIRGLANQIPALQTSIEAVRASQIPLSEHLDLMQKVNKLWSEHEQREGKRNLLLAWRAALTVIVSVVTVLLALKELGFKINIS